MMEYTRVYKPLVLKKARDVSVKFSKPKSIIDSDGDKYTLVKAICRGETIPRNVEFHLYGSGKTAQVWCSCDCEFWLYHCEVAMQKKGSSDILHSNGAKPRVTNPKMIPSLCKHCCAALLNGAHTLKPVK